MSMHYDKKGKYKLQDSNDVLAFGFQGVEPSLKKLSKKIKAGY